MTWARLGPLGGLRDIPNPTPETVVESSRAENTFPLLGGYVHVQRSPRRSRAWRLGHIWQAPELLAYLTACAEGAIPGPLYLHTQDAALTNLLPSDVAAPCRMGTVALGSVSGVVAVGIGGGAVPMSGVVQQASAGAWSAIVPIRQVAHVLSGWASAAGVAVEWRMVTAAGVQVATGTVTAAAVTGGFYGAVSIVPGVSVAGVQVRLAAGSRTVGGLRLVEGVRPEDGVEVRRNLARYPNAEGGTAAGWGVAGAATVVSSTEQARSGSRSYKVVTSGGAASQGAAQTVALSDGVTPSGTAGTETVSAWVYAPAGAALRMIVEEYIPGGAWVALRGTTAFTGAGAWQRVSVQGAKSVGGNVLRLGVLTQTAQAITFYLDDALNEASPALLPYLDGATSPDSDLAPSWTGAANASPSILKTIPEGAVWPGWAPGVGVPQVVVGDPQQTLQLATATEVLSDYTVTIREVG